MSEITSILIKQKDGYTTALKYYICPEKPKASILILHGMAEHQKRYQSFAEYLLRFGYDVYIYDHRGHGLDKKLSDLGFFASENGFQQVIDDVIAVSNYITENNRSDKFFLIGHSMGSIIARNVIQTYDKYNGIILSGTPFPPSLLTSSGLFISNIIKKMKGPKHISPFMSNLMFGGKKYTSLSSRTAFDWLSRSNTIVGAYIHDPYCGFICTVSFYNDLLKLTQNSTKKSQINLTRKDIPIFVVSGEKDPVGNNGKDVHKFVDTLTKCGFSQVTLKLYPECRHEILNELNNDEVYADFQQWITDRI